MMPVFSERYLIFVDPAFYLLVALGIHTLWQHWKGLAMAGLVAVLVVHGAGVYVQGTQTIKPDIRGAATHYLTARAPDDLVLFLIPQSQGAFELVAPADEQIYMGVPYTNRNQSALDIEMTLSELIGAGRRVWLVESESALWDARGLTRQWLSAHSQNVTTTEFHRVTLTLFEEIDK